MAKAVGIAYDLFSFLVLMVMMIVAIEFEGNEESEDW